MIGILTANKKQLDLDTSIAIPRNYSIADGKEPNKRKRSFSKTISLPGTANNMRFFSSTYQMSLSTVGGTSDAGFNYDPTIRVDASYTKGANVEFRGLLQLNQVVVAPDGSYSFEVTLFSNMVDLYLALGDMKVSELGWGEYNHSLTRTNVKNSFATSVKKNGVDTSNFSGGEPLAFGYHYGLVDYGYTRTAPKTFKTNDIVPLVYAKEVLTKCMQVASIGFTSIFLNTTTFRRLLLGWGGGEKTSISPAEVANRRTKFTGTYTKTLNLGGFAYRDVDGLYYASFATFNQFSNVNTGTGFTATVVNDFYQQYELSAGQVTIERTGTYKLVVSELLSAALNIGTMTYVRGSGNISIIILKNGSFNGLGSASNQNAPGFGNVNANLTYNFDLTAGDVIEVRIQVSSNLTYRLSGGADTLQPLILTLTSSNFSFDLTSVQTTLNDGSTVELSRFIADIKAADFMTGIITAYNLYMSDPDIDGICTIEPLTQFYRPTNEFDDWTQLVDHSQPETIKPASTIEGKRYNFKWAEDNDYDNKRYRDKFGIGYGDFTYQVPSTWQKGDRDYVLPFAQTIPTDQLSPLIVPRIISVDETTQIVKPYKGKPRLYLWNGLKTGKWRLTNVVPTSFEDLSTFPAVHHFDNYQAPTFDLNWGLPQELQYSTSVVTNKNWWSQFHEIFIKEITGKDSKLVNLFVRLNSNMIANLDFSKLKMINGVLFRLNEIKDYDSNVSESTEVELLKIIAANNKAYGTLVIKNPAIKDTVKVVSPVKAAPEVKVIRGGVAGSASQTTTLKKG